MDYSNLKAEIKAIAEIAESIPEAFREKCFELLLNHLLAPAKKPIEKEALPGRPGPEIEGDEKKEEGQQPIPKPAAVKAFMKKTGVTDQQLSSVVYFEDGELHFLAEPSTSTIRRGQMEWGFASRASASHHCKVLRSRSRRAPFHVPREGLLRRHQLLEDFQVRQELSPLQRGA